MPFFGQTGGGGGGGDLTTSYLDELLDVQDYTNKIVPRGNTAGADISAITVALFTPLVEVFRGTGVPSGDLGGAVTSAEAHYVNRANDYLYVTSDMGVTWTLVTDVTVHTSQPGNGDGNLGEALLWKQANQSGSGLHEYVLYYPKYEGAFPYNILGFVPPWGESTSPANRGLWTTGHPKFDFGLAFEADVTAVASDLAALQDDVLYNSGGEYNLAVTATPVSGSVSLDMSVANTFRVAVSQNTTFSFTNLTAPTGFASRNRRFIIELSNTNTTNHTLTWPASVTWVGKEVRVPMDTTTISVVNLVTNDDGTSFYAWQDIGNGAADTLVAEVVNAEATTLTRGTVVYLFGATGDKASVKRANNSSDATSSKTLGIVREDIAAGATGFVVTQGQIFKMTTGSYTPGDSLWLSGTDGQFTSTKPAAPNHTVFIGVVERANNGNGIIYVRAQNGFELDEIHDVQLTSPTNGDVLVYESIDGVWKNRQALYDYGFPTLVGPHYINAPQAALTEGNIGNSATAQFMQAIRPAYTLTVGNIQYFCRTAGTQTVQLGIYTHNAATNVFTLVARTAAAVPTGNQQIVTAPLSTAGGFPATYTLNAGTLYYIGYVVNTGTTATYALFNSGTTVTGLSTTWALGNVPAGTLPYAGQIATTGSALVTTFTGAAFTTATYAARLWMRLIP